MGVILAWSQTGEQGGSGLLVKVSTESPSRCENEAEVQEDEGDTLLGVLNEG